MGFETERRGDQRVQVKGVVVELPDLEASLRDVSASGAYIEDPRPLPPGRLVRIRLKLSQQLAINTRAMVRRVDEGVGMGIEFMEMSGEDRAKLRTFLEGKLHRESEDP